MRLCNKQAFKEAHLCNSSFIKTKKMTIKVELKGNWSEQKEKLQLKYPTLTNSDLAYNVGKKDEMLGKLQVKLGKTQSELYTIIEAL
jgi:hypothetical protein